MTFLPINLPPNCHVLVAVGDKVNKSQLIAEKKSSQVGKVLPLAKILSVSPKTTIKYLKKQMGDRVRKGELLAEKSNVLKGEKVLSPYSGTLFKLEEETGDLYIITEPSFTETSERQKGDVFSPVEGKVIFCDNTRIVLETDKNAVYAKDAAGEKSQGELHLITDKKIDYNKIPEKVEGKVILGEEFAKAAVYKAIAMGTAGIICQNVEDADFKEFEEKQIKVPIFEVSKEDFTKLTKLSGKTVYLEPEERLVYYE